MKWGRKNQPSSSSSSSKSSPFSTKIPFLSHVLRSSWLSKFKPQPKPAKGNVVSDVGEGRFYGGERDAFWRLEEKINAGMLRSVWYEPGDELGCRRCGPDAVKKMVAERNKRYGNEIAWDVKRMDGFRRDTEILRGEKAMMIKTPRVIERKRYEEAVKEIRLRVHRNKSEAEQKSTKFDEKFTTNVEPVKRNPSSRRAKLSGSSLKKPHNFSPVNLKSLATEKFTFAAQNMDESHRLYPEWRKQKEMKIEEVKMKSEKQRKSLYMSRELPRRRPKQAKVGVFSPRTPSKVETCKIKAFEDMKKAKLKMKGSKQRRRQESTSLESFAVEKCSTDPEKDFRDSMTEMIMEEKITRPEELEELLACYLTLNSDEYHDLIIKAFRQVWFDLDHTSSEPFHTEFDSEEYFQS